MRSRATSGPDSAESAPLGDGTPSLWRPLRTPIFRNLLIADVMSDIGTFMQTVGAAWLMVSLGAAADRQIAEVRAREVTGVFDVENGLIVAR